jgi:hypothetical protein
MTGLVHDHHWQLCRYLVQIVSSWMTLLLELCIVVAEANDPAVLARELLVLMGPCLQRGLQFGDVVHLTVRARQQVGRDRLDACVEHMSMRVDEAGYERFAAQIDDPRPGTIELHHLVAIPDGDDSTACNGNGLGLRLKFIDGDDVATGIDGIGGCHWGSDRNRLPEACGDC